ncbi:MAG: class I SAM-dependent methyltransferase [Rhodospirillaceae bacterium]|nr:class I SAM-dependent methyltransferase [Rhodospirillaceae bacterium]
MAALKADDIRPRRLMRDQTASMQADIAFLQGNRDRFVDAACPACDSSARRPLYRKYDLEHVVCDHCATQYIAPRPDAELLSEFYAQSANYSYWAKEIFPASAEVRRERIFQPRAERVRDLVARHPIGGTMIEVGAGFGLFCDEVRKLGLFSRIVGIEPTPDLARICRDLGFECHETSYEKAPIGGRAGLIAAFEVIEHLFSPKAFLEWCFATLAPGGAVLMTCPNIAGFETLCLGERSETVDHEHLNLFNPASLALLAERVGFRGIEVTTLGRLDVDIVRSALADGTVTTSDLGPFAGHLLASEDDDVLERLQDFLSEAKLSSNMQLVAFRPAGA